MDLRAFVADFWEEVEDRHHLISTKGHLEEEMLVMAYNLKDNIFLLE